MTSQELKDLANADSDQLAEMIMSEVERQGDMAMSREELTASQQWVARAKAAQAAAQRG